MFTISPAQTAAKREAAAHLCTVHGVSQRRACRAIGVDRALVRYQSRRPDGKAVRTRLRELAAVHRRFGWRRFRILAVVDDYTQEKPVPGG